MPTGPSQPSTSRAAMSLPPQAQRALATLQEAHQWATRLGVPVWQFAESIRSLWAQGIPTAALRLLCAAGLAECRLEQSRLDEPERTFGPLDHLAMPAAACLIATPAGLELALPPSAAFAGAGVNGVPQAPAGGPVPHMPRWDRKDTLWWGPHVIKRLRPDARSQRLVLASLQELHWPHRMDDPLPRGAGRNSKECLRQTVRHLNQHHQQRVIEFWSDQSFQGICWGRL